MDLKRAGRWVGGFRHFLSNLFVLEYSAVTLDCRSPFFFFSLNLEVTKPSPKG